MRGLKLISIIFLLFMAGPAGAAPALWQITDDDTTLYIFGTVHVLKPGTEWLNDEFESVISGADKIYLEVSAKEQQNRQANQALLKKYGLLPEGQTLSDRLPEETGKRITKALISAGANKAAIQRFKPWLAGLTYASLRFLKLGYNPNAGVEATIIGLAQAKGIPVGGLETMEFQFSIFNSLSKKEAINFVRSTLDESENLEKRMARITSAWIDGNLTALEKLLLQDVKKMPGMAETIFYERNRYWKKKVEGIMAESGQYLVAVGTGHLLGRKSLLALLEKGDTALNGCIDRSPGPVRLERRWIPGNGGAADPPDQ